MDFHPSGDLLLVAGEDKHMRFFKIDGEKNEKQLSVRLNDMSIQQAAFRRCGLGNNNNTEVLACGRKPFFYSYDTESGNVAKIPGNIFYIYVHLIDKHTLGSSQFTLWQFR